MRRILPMAMAALMLVMPHSAHPQTSDADAAKNAQQARAALDAMVQALGGQAWLDMKNQMRRDTSPRSSMAIPTSAPPSMGVPSWPDKDRIEYTKHRDVIEFFVGRQGWEVNYRGKTRCPRIRWTNISAAAITPSKPQ